MIQYIRSYIVHYLIRRALASLTRTKRVVNLAEASTIGILFSLTDEQDYHYINSIVNQLIASGKEVKTIGFLPQKQIPNYYIAKLKMDIITPKDVNWLGISKKPFVESFIQEEFDLLIDLNAGDCLALDYISGLSHANFKTGRYSEKMIQVFDFMIKRSEGMESKRFSETVIGYLRTINTN